MSRSIDDLVPKMQIRATEFADKFDTLIQNRKEGITLLIYCTYRSFEEQARLYRQGRPYYKIKQMADNLVIKYGREDLREILLGVGPQYGKVVTYAAPGQSMHNYGMAFDAVPLKAGKPLWSKKEEAWQRFGVVAKTIPLEWAGNWKRFIEYPHLQLPGVDWEDLIRGGQNETRS